MDNNCIYCAQGDSLDKLMVYICDLKFSKLYLFRDQTHYGRCVVACNKHVKELYDLQPDEVAAFSNDIANAAKAIAKTVSPVKINYGMYGDKMSHVHCHVVPKDESAPNFGGTFAMAYSPPKHLSEEEYRVLIEKIKENLEV